MVGAKAPAVFFGALLSAESPGGAMPTVNNRGLLFYVPFTNRSKRGLPLSGSKFGSILSQPGER